MTNKKTILILALLFVVLLSAAAVLYSSLSKKEAAVLPETETAAPETVNTEKTDSGEQPAEATTAAPDFTVLNINGESVKLSEHIGKPVVLNFWASWCGPCKSEMPEFDAAAAEYGDQVDFMMVNLTDGSRETVEGASKFIEEQGYSFPMYFDTEYEGALAYSVRSIPATYFIDKDGNILAYYSGSLNGETLRKGIDLILQQ